MDAIGDKSGETTYLYNKQPVLTLAIDSHCLGWLYKLSARKKVGWENIASNFDILASQSSVDSVSILQ
jgi:hypothetical protein